MVSTHSRLKAAGIHNVEAVNAGNVSTHSRLKAAGTLLLTDTVTPIVSTHSRLKAAGSWLQRFAPDSCRFNTQPPKGGWARWSVSNGRRSSFNTQPPKGGWIRSPNRVSLL